MLFQFGILQLIKEMLHKYIHIGTYILHRANIPTILSYMLFLGEEKKLFGGDD